MHPPQAVLHLPFLILWALSSQEKATSLPSDLAQDLRGLEAQLRRHEGLEHELVGTGQQVSLGLAASPTQAPVAPSALPSCSSRFSVLPWGLYLGSISYGRAWPKEESVGWAGPSDSWRI